jgi:hypothetical protein
MVAMAAFTSFGTTSPLKKTIVTSRHDSAVIKAPVKHAARHVLSVARVALDHLIGRLETSVGDFGDCQLFVVGFFGGDDGGVGGQREMDPGVGHQVGLEFRQVDVQSSVETQRGGDGRNNLE